MKQKIRILVGVWAVFALVNFLAPQKVFSEAENRYLQEKPEWKKEAVLNGSYMEEYETWMSDQLIGRDALVSVKATADLLTGKGDSGGVYLGKDGYLLEMFTEVDEKHLWENVGAVTVFLSQMEQAGVKGSFLLVPTAAHVLENKLPAFAPELDQTAWMERIGEAVPGFIDVTENLRKGAKTEDGSFETQIYYKTDHHWTGLGAYYAYETFCEKTGREMPDLGAYEFTVLSDAFYGTGYAKAGLYHLEPDVMTAVKRKDQGALTVDYGNQMVESTLYDKSFLEKRDKYRVYLKGNYPLTKITTEAQTGEKLLLVKDSYANTFVQFLTEDFSEIHMVDLRYFKSDLASYVREEGITEVLFLYQIRNFAEDTNLSGLVKES